MLIERFADPVDVAIIGGSYAGLSAGLQLARTRRPVVVIDGGAPRNRFARVSHGFFGQDGRTPGEITAAARAQLMTYPTLRWVHGLAVTVARQHNEFSIAVADQGLVLARRVILALGVVDELPAIHGLAERWGTHVFHCPYCHGYELNQGRIGVLATGPHAHHQAMMLPDWGQVTLFTNGAVALDDAQSAALVGKGVTIEPGRVARIVDQATIELADGRRVELDGIFTAPRSRPSSTIAAQLECAMDEGPLGPFIRTDAMKATTVPGVFACGDAARAAGSIAMAVGDGAQAGVSAHRSLLCEAA
jgi:thioredoxin reductase